MDKENKDLASQTETAPADNTLALPDAEVVPVVAPGDAFVPTGHIPSPQPPITSPQRDRVFAPPPAPPDMRTPAPAPNTGAPSPADILLPNKEIHSPTNAQRASAGVLFEKERTATLAPTAPPIAENTAPVHKENPSVVQPLETYQGDIARVVKEKNISTVSIASAEALRRGAAADEGDATRKPEGAPASLTRKLTVVAGAVFLVGALGIGGYLMLRQSIAPSAAEYVSSYIAIDDAEPVVIEAGATHKGVMQTLTSAKNTAALSLGLIEAILPVSSTTNVSAKPLPLSAQTFLPLLAPNIPADLLRTVQPEMLLGVHAYAANQPFLIFRVDSYEQGFSGMLLWEGSMKQDLSPLFDYAPTVRIQSAADESTTMGNVSTSTSASSSQTTSDILQSGFTDRVIENHDARVVEDSAHNVVLLWTFLNKKTILITTNQYTLREIISRLKEAPILPLP